MKNIVKTIVIFSALVLTGCASTHGIQLTTKTVPVAVPLLYAPAPPVLTRPELPHITISPNDDKIDGKVVQSYAASVQALIGYAEELERIIANYKDINDAYAVVRAKLIADWKANTGTDITIKDPTVQVDKSGGVSVDPPAITPKTETTPVVPSVDDLVKHH